MRTFVQLRRSEAQYAELRERIAELPRTVQAGDRPSAGEEAPDEQIESGTGQPGAREGDKWPDRAHGPLQPKTAT
jgi:hypothetical protein